MQLTEVALGALIGGGGMATARATGTALRPHLGQIGGAAALATAAGGGAYGAWSLTHDSAEGSVAAQRDAVSPDVGPSGWLVAGDIVAGLSALGSAGMLASTWGDLGARGRLGYGTAAVALGAATIAGTIGLVRSNGRANAEVDAWRTAHPDQVKQLPKPKPAAPSVPAPKQGSGTKAHATTHAADPNRVAEITRLTTELYNDTDYDEQQAHQVATHLVDSYGAEGAADRIDAASHLYNQSDFDWDESMRTMERLTTKYGTSTSEFVDEAMHVYNDTDFDTTEAIDWTDRLYDRVGTTAGPAVVDQAVELYNSTDLDGQEAFQQVYDDARAPKKG